MLTPKQKEILIAVSHGHARFNDIKKQLKIAGLSISGQGLTKNLKKLKTRGYIIDSLQKGLKGYKLTDAGNGYLDKYYWPLIDEITTFNRDEWPSKTFDSYTDTQQILYQYNAINHRAFYAVPMALEYHSWILAELADSIISSDYTYPKHKDVSDLYIVSKIKLSEVEKISKAFSGLWFPKNITKDDIFDIISNLTAKQPEYLKRSALTSLGIMLSVAGMKKENRKKAKEIDKKLTDVVFKRPEIISDLDQKIVDIFVEDIENDLHPLEDPRLGDHLIRNLETPYGKRQLFLNLQQDYLIAALLKKSDMKFRTKMSNYFHGTQSILLQMLKYETDHGVHSEAKNPDKG